MQITRISRENEGFFLPLLPREAKTVSRDILRLGVLDDSRKAVGALTAYPEEGFIEINSVYVLPDYRRQGFGRALVSFLEDTVKGEGIGSLSCEFYGSEEAVSFARAVGFDLFKGAYHVTFTVGELYRSPLYKRHIEGKKISVVKPVSELSIMEKKMFRKYIEGGSYDPEWSTVIFKEDKYQSSLLAGSGDNYVDIIFIHSRVNSTGDILRHLRAVALKAVDKFRDNKEAQFRLCIADEKRIRNLAGLLGSMGHVHRRGFFMRGVKVL